MKKLFLVLYILITGNCIAQSKYFQGVIYNFSENILSNLANDTADYGSFSKYQFAATELSYIGDYKNALAVWDSANDKASNISVKDSLYFSNCRPVNAHQYIIERAKHEQIIILNEAHHQPMHRVFTESLLHDLYEIGFRYFGGETIAHFDTELNSRKYPIAFSGTYSKEPCYGNMLRSALQNGYYVFAYEADFSGESNITPTKREIEEAKNIKAILDTNPKARIIIHCGYDHLVETELPGWEKAMAGRLKEYTGIDPFTIDQTRLTEKGSPEYDNPFYKIANLDYDAVFLDSSGNPFNGSQDTTVYNKKYLNQYDIRVYHPRTKWIDGRPDWILKNNRLPYFVNDKITVDFPCIVVAFCDGEDENKAVPTDAIELKNKSDKTALSLRKGKYKIIIRRNTLNDQELKIELR